MEDVKIILSALWVALMLTYLLGDVMRIFTGDFQPGEIEGKPMTQTMLLGMAIIMLIPIVMVFLSLTLPDPVNRWANIIFAIGLFGFNLLGLPTYRTFHNSRLCPNIYICDSDYPPAPNKPGEAPQGQSCGIRTPI